MFQEDSIIDLNREVRVLGAMFVSCQSVIYRKGFNVEYKYTKCVSPKVLSFGHVGVRFESSGWYIIDRLDPNWSEKVSVLHSMESKS